MKKRVILVFTKPKFKTQLHIGFSAKKKNINYVVNQMIFSMTEKKFIIIPKFL
jgi:hypothetical protein